MSRTTTAPLTTEQAVTRARQMIEQANKLAEAVDTVKYSRRGNEQEAAETLKEARLLSYRVTTIPDALTPVLEALIAAASKGAELSEAQA